MLIVYTCAAKIDSNASEMHSHLRSHIDRRNLQNEYFISSQ